MSTERQELIEKIATMDAWQLAQFSVAMRALGELSKEDFNKFHDLVCKDGIPVFEAAARFGMEIMLDEFMAEIEKAADVA